MSSDRGDGDGFAGRGRCGRRWSERGEDRPTFLCAFVVFRRESKGVSTSRTSCGRGGETRLERVKMNALCDGCV